MQLSVEHFNSSSFSTNSPLQNEQDLLDRMETIWDAGNVTYGYFVISLNFSNTVSDGQMVV